MPTADRIPLTEPGGTPARRRLSVGRRREELVAAALELLADHAPDEISIDDVARAAGASRALVYHYFGSKQDLFLAALRTAGAELTTRLTPPEDGSPVERLTASIHGYVEYADEHAAGFTALMLGRTVSRGSDVAEVVDRVRGTVLRMLLDGLGVANPDVTLRLTLRGWLASNEAIVLDWLGERGISALELEEMMIRNLGALLAAIGRLPDI